MGLRTRIFLPMLVLGVAFALFMTVVWRPRFIHQDAERHVHEYRMQLDMLGRTLVEPLLSGDLSTVYHTLDDVEARYATWKHIELYAPDGKKLYPLDIRKTVPAGSDIHSVRRPIIYRDKRIGVIEAWFDLAPALQAGRRRIADLEWVFLGILLLGGLGVGLLIERLVRKPVADLALAAGALGQGDFDYALPASRDDEIGRLVRHFGTMRDNVRLARSELRRELEERHRAEQSVARNLEVQRVLAGILGLSLQPMELATLLEEVLDRVLKLPWLAVEARGCVMLLEEDVLVMRARHNLPEEVVSTCSIVPLGTCLCGRAAVSGEVVATAHVDECHPLRVPVTRPHGNMVVPIRSGTSMYGVMNFFLEDGFNVDRQQKKFMAMLADTLAGIIERKRKEAQLREQAQILDQIHDAVMTIDTDGRVRNWNGGAVRLFGYSADEILGQHFSVLLPEDARHFFPAEIAALVKRPNWRNAEMEMRKSDAGKFDAHLSLSLLHNEDGQLSGLLGYIVDITGRKRTERALQASEERFRGLVETTHDWIWEMDAEGVYTYASPRVVELLGYEVAEVVGRTPFDFMAADEAARFTNILREISSQQVPFDNLENTVLHKHGRVVVLEASGVPFFDAGGRLLGYRGINRDVTSRKLAERAVQESEEKYRTIMEYANDAILVATLDGRIVEVNHRAEHLLGYTREEFSQLTAREIHPESEAENLKAAFKDMTEKGRSLYEHLVVRKDGSVISVEVAGAMVQYHGRKVALGIFRDISERKEAEERLRRAKEELELRVQERTAELVDNNRRLAGEVGERRKAEHALRQALEELRVQKHALDQHSIVSITDSFGTITYANDKMSEISGYSPDELLGQNHRMLNSGYHPKTFFRDLWDTIGQGRVWQGDVCNRAKDGSLYWVATTIVPFMDERNQPYQYVVIRTAITERKRLEQAQRERQERLSRQHDALLRIAKEIVPEALDLMSALQKVNEVVSSTLGTERSNIWLYDEQSDVLRCEDLYLRNVHQHVRGAELPRLDHPQLFDYLQTNRILASDDTEGDPRIAELQSSYLIPNDIRALMSAPVRLVGGAVGWVCIEQTGRLRHWNSDEQNFAGAAADVVALIMEQHSRRQAEAKVAAFAEEMQKINEELDSALVKSQEAVRVKSEFLATMSHEIRTPMNGILGMLDLLVDTKLDDEQQDYVGIALKSGHSLLQQLNNILDFSKLEAGRLELERSRFDIHETVEDVVSMMLPYARENNIDLQWELGPGIPDAVNGDATRLRQVLTNLVSNAIKFTTEGEVNVHAKVLPKRGDETVLQFVVSDSGIGIAPEHHQRIFEVFTQADSSTTRRYGGSGLGLSICKELVERMGGHIGLESSPGEGSTFWFTMPVGTVADAAERAVNR